jgi:hypothetical protein
MMMATSHTEIPPMRIVEFASFPQDEQDDFRWSCRRWLKKFDDFVVTAEERSPASGSPGPVQRDVIVRHRPTGRARSYNACQGSWNRKFDDDLQASFYGH